MFWYDQSPHSGCPEFAHMIRLCLVLLFLAALSPAAFCQVPQTPGFSSEGAIEKRLAEVRQEQAGLGEDARNTKEAELLRQLEIALVQHREAVDYLGQIKQQAKAIDESLQGWTGFESPPPYSVQFAGSQQSKKLSLEREYNATESRLRIIARIIDETTNALSTHQGAARQFLETAQASGTSQAKRDAEARARLETLMARIDAEILTRMQLRQNAHEIEIAALNSALELSGIKLAAVKGKVEFTQSELDQIQQTLATMRGELLAEAQAKGLKQQSQQITWKIDLLDIESKFWDATYRAFNAGGDSEFNKAIEDLQGLQSRADDWVEVIRLHAGASGKSQTSVIGAEVTVADLEQVTELQYKIRFAREMLGDEGINVPGILNHTVNGLLAVWNLELYLAEETRSVAGEKISTYSAVTLGKILRLIVILLLGWFALRFLSRQLYVLLSRSGRVDPAKAELAKSWTFGLGITILVIIALNRVHIPFTAFAFLGGTLAIGIGFGAQTLLKNFISGVILSIERPFKVGDLIEVDTIMGNIIRIGLRASVIRHFDGTDTLVPNSSLLENRVSNWTFADNTMRDQISVGVAYGSSSREVSRALLAVAESHGQVLKKPEPTVQFEEFGDNSLKFELLYWFDAMRVRAEPLASDLRFMVNRALKDLGIVVAFPQRDIHFDSQPLRVELTRKPRDPDSKLEKG